MNTLAHSGGPGPWGLLFPLVRAAVVMGTVTLPRRTVWRGRRGPWGAARTSGAVAGESSPIALLGRRFAAGEIDEDEYWRRLSVLDEQFGRAAGSGKA
ncbi:SHOCT domain-containing protein [Streptomyces sp. DH7]|uniref:SHOCT domain-containing protein n=1 Tax=Streptomyces sp. DH7 TaxID=2857006 RepID=UPI001E3F7747|nr:SHOCT domain-containing protein [Streptomyces sp. DH7]